ncbi:MULTISPECIES: RDD family protein [Gammaproteobacteria]|uniref:RDD family protein n=1 Tax=Gammaproteobacteria TaxID=1236 RepID=UPI000DCFD46A|nr:MULTISPECIES: RDD family protein [Gammaproteobacteria]RTE86357.1 RDD family protein [Aliidiomarina sp. B3213]TCZ91707.1 RDD family protein [Lysobacter sp. N42]
MENREYAGFWIRFGAVIIDAVVIFIVLTIPLRLIYGQQYFVGDELIYGFWDVVLGYIVPFIATIWFWVRYLGTPGKMATRLEIVDAKTGKKMSTLQAVARYFAYIVSILSFGLGFIWVGIDHKKRGWHDMLVGTVVIRNTQKAPVEFDESEENSGSELDRALER